MTGSAPVGFDRLAREILAMAEADQRMRGGQSGPDPETDRRNASRLRDIVAEIGWPTRSKVGEQAEHMAWLLAQHADHDPAFQRSCLTRMREQAAGEVCAQHLAYLEDRLRVNEKRPQLFGTQFFTDDRGRFAPHPIEEPERLDDRRASVGLGPFTEYQRLIADVQRNARPVRRLWRLRLPWRKA